MTPDLDPETDLSFIRTLAAPRRLIWDCWTRPEHIPHFFVPAPHKVVAVAIDLRVGGEWVFDMIGPDGTTYPNHHLCGEMRAGERLSYTLLWGENGPRHADAWAAFEEEGGATRVVLGMVFTTEAEFQTAKGFGAEALGLQTLGKLARFVGAD